MSEHGHSNEDCADYLERMDVLPGFREGMQNVEKDEQRHIAFGVKLLADLNRQDPEVRPAVREILGTVMPYALGVFRPPNDDERYIEVSTNERYTIEVKLLRGFQFLVQPKVRVNYTLDNNSY